MAAPLARAVPGGEALEDDALDVVGSAGVEEVVSVRAWKPAENPARPVQGKALESLPAVGIGPIDE
jgi:hypothetical protein